MGARKSLLGSRLQTSSEIVTQPWHEKLYLGASQANLVAASGLLLAGVAFDCMGFGVKCAHKARMHGNLDDGYYLKCNHSGRRRTLSYWRLNISLKAIHFMEREE